MLCLALSFIPLLFSRSSAGTSNSRSRPTVAALHRPLPTVTTAERREHAAGGGSHAETAIVSLSGGREPPPTSPQPAVRGCWTRPWRRFLGRGYRIRINDVRRGGGGLISNGMNTFEMGVKPEGKTLGGLNRHSMSDYLGENT